MSDAATYDLIWIAKWLAIQGALFPLGMFLAHVVVSGELHINAFTCGGATACLMLRLMDAGYLWSVSRAK